MGTEGKKIKKVLAVNLGGVGDIILSTPALRGLRSLYPKARILMMVGARTADIARELSYIDEVVTFDVKYRRIIPPHQFLRDAMVLAGLRGRRFDLAINMRTLVSESSAGKIKFIFDIIKPATTVGRNTDGRGHFFDVKIPEKTKGEKYEMEYDIDAVKALGGEVKDRRVDLFISGADRARVQSVLNENGIRGDAPLVGMHPGGMPSRRWPAEHFARVIDELSAKASCNVVLTGGPDEAALSNSICRMAEKKPADLSGKLKAKELGALIERCALYISNDTGPMHIAAALNTPLVAIFGPGDITRYDPRNISDKAVVLYESQDCAPCERAECDDLKCLKAISPGDVTTAGLGLLSKKG